MIAEEEKEERSESENGEHKAKGRRERVMVRRPISGTYEKIEPKRGTDYRERRYDNSGATARPRRPNPFHSESSPFLYRGKNERNENTPYEGRPYQENSYPRRNYTPREGGRNYNERYNSRNSYHSYNERRPNTHHETTGENTNSYRPYQRESNPFLERNRPTPRPDYRGGFQQRGMKSRPFPAKRGNNQRPYSSNLHIKPKYVEENVDITKEIRLNKFLSNAGICSRREADEYIKKGEISVNGEVVTELGHKILLTDTIVFRGKQVGTERKVYILLNKPKDYVTTSEDPEGRKIVMDLIKGACEERVYPVGRLDRNSTGVLLLTNDGDLADKLTHPKFEKKKIYNVLLDRDISQEDLQKLADGVQLEDGEAHADAISYSNLVDHNQIGIEIHSGKNRIVRRMLDAVGYKVLKLDRVFFAGLTKKGLKRGDWRFLTQEEVNRLKMGAYE